MVTIAAGVEDRVVTADCAAEEDEADDKDAVDEDDMEEWSRSSLRRSTVQGLSLIHI